MFEETLKFLKSLDGSRVTVDETIPEDEEGFIDRECPNDICKFSFKINADDWSNIVRDEEVFCPMCGHTANSQSWFTEVQVEHLQRQALSQVSRNFDNALKRDASSFNRRQQKNSFVSISMNVKSTPTFISLPAQAAEVMEQKIACSECACRFSVVGSAFFRPSCGHNSIDHVFFQSLEIVDQTLSALPTICSQMRGKDEAKNTERVLIENSLQNIITAFQHFASSMLKNKRPQQKIRKNAFQNLREGSGLWNIAFGKQYSDHLSKAELEELQIHFQRRHLLAHCEGLVDSDYIKNCNDKSHQIGQRIIVGEGDVKRCLQLVRSLADAMKKDIS